MHLEHLAAPREVEKGPCATGRFRRHLDGFRHFTVHMNHNEVYICVCEAKLRPRCNMYLMRSRRDLACITDAKLCFIAVQTRHQMRVAAEG